MQSRRKNHLAAANFIDDEEIKVQKPLTLLPIRCDEGVHKALNLVLRYISNKTHLAVIRNNYY
jgi:hypothetical protein